MSKKALGAVLVLLALLATGSASPCTMVTAEQEGNVLVGNNEDATEPNTKVWFVPPEQGRYGGIYFGWDERWPQGGMNDQGLVFDIFRTPYLEIKRSQNKPRSEEFITRKVMAEAATVKEALDILDRFSLTGLEYGQLMYVDRTGDAAIFEGDVIHRRNGPHMIATNFYLSQIEEGVGITCPRYKIADEMLTTMTPSVETFRKILNATHFEGNWGGTQYSNIYMPEKGQIHLYHFHNYDEVVIFDIQEELAKGARSMEIADLFPRNFAYLTYLEAQPETATAVLARTLKENGIEAAVEQARLMTEGWQELEPIFQRYFSDSPVEIAGAAQNWKPASIAGQHKTRDLQIGPSHLKDLARDLGLAGQVEEAIRLLQANAELYPGTLENHYWLGVFFRDLGQYARAREHLTRAEEISPGNPWVEQALIQLEQAEEQSSSGREEA
jgi:tetratricopeptide (TPR) repeat protein